jgi:hypothetical protein
MRSETESSPLEVSKTTKPPRLILEGLYAFSPNRETLGGTSYLIVENTGNILVDCPGCDESERDFLREKGSVTYFLPIAGVRVNRAILCKLCLIVRLFSRNRKLICFLTVKLPFFSSKSSYLPLVAVFGLLAILPAPPVSTGTVTGGFYLPVVIFSPTPRVNLDPYRLRKLSTGCGNCDRKRPF